MIVFYICELYNIIELKDYFDVYGEVWKHGIDIGELTDNIESIKIRI